MAGRKADASVTLTNAQLAAIVKEAVALALAQASPAGKPKAAKKAAKPKETAVQAKRIVAREFGWVYDEAKPVYAAPFLRTLPKAERAKAIARLTAMGHVATAKFIAS
jgi:hypothetical protein